MELGTDSIPTLVLMGPTNVGKSTLFNRMTGTRRAIVCDRPGVTVDRQEFIIENSPVIGKVKVIDTGGVGPEALKHPLGAEIERAAKVAVQEADVLLFVVDGTRELGLEEIEAVEWLRHIPNIKNENVWIVANKSDAKKFDASSYYMLGYEKVFSVSAEHDEGMLELWEALAAQIKPDLKNQEMIASKSPRILVLGRPNVGKSTLLNSILGKDRHVVSELAGTTRDTIESSMEHQGQLWSFCDTAGMRRPGRVERDVEWVAREKIKEAARKADLAIIMIDSTEGVTEQDAAIAGMAIDFGLSVIIAFNKWDKMRGSQEGAEDLLLHLDRSTSLKMDFLQWVPKIQISGLTGKGIPELLKTIQRVLEARQYRAQTSKLNEVFEKKLRLHSHPVGPRGKSAKFYFLTQVHANPPEFVLFSNLASPSVHFSFKRYISNTLRSEFGFVGTPIRLHFKTARH